MKIKLPKIKLPKFARALTSTRAVYTVIVIIVLAVLVQLGYFMYKNFYQVILQSEDIILLRQEVAPESIDFNKVSQVLEKLENKKNLAETVLAPEDLTDPFALAAPPPDEAPAEGEIVEPVSQ